MPAPTPPHRPGQGFFSPLRYPGGKGRVARYIAELIRAQHPRPSMYAEPFAGGAGAALRLLVDEVVEAVLINDLNPGIAAFWRCVFDRTDEFARKITDATVSVPAWKRHRRTYQNPEGVDDLALGFATFFLNRTNRSGILGARPIGGLDQTGRWKIDARFNKDDLANRIRFLGEYRHRVAVSQSDARTFLTDLVDQGLDPLVYVDPPYMAQGEELYLDSLTYEDHCDLAQLLCGGDLRWFLTYDCDDRITDELYVGLRCARFNIKHTVQRRHIGSEYAVFSDNLNVPTLDILPRDEGEWVVV